MFVYRKALRLSSVAKKETTTGKIVNLMSVDVDHVADFIAQFAFLWAAPLQLITILVLLIVILGPAALAGVFVMIITVPIQAKIMTIVSKYEEQMTNTNDERMKKVNELLQGLTSHLQPTFLGMKIIKFYAWEKHFIASIEKVRSNQLRILLRLVFGSRLSLMVMQLVPLFVAVVTFGTFSLINGHPFTVQQAFTSITLFKMLQEAITISWVVTGTIEAYISLHRLSRFARAQELDRYGYLGKVDEFSTINENDPNAGFLVVMKELLSTLFRSIGCCTKRTQAQYSSLSEGGDQIEIIDDFPKKIVEPTDISAKISNGSFSWDFETTYLKNINVEFPVGLTIIVGAVGSGKSSLLSALLGEMRQVESTESSCVSLNGRVSYCSQIPWVLNASLRENILFGKPFDQKKYNSVIEACALLPDLEVLKAGDQTEIGEKGINLSGGQKQRVSIARAIYSDSDIYIFDDPLSALDAHVGKHVMENCILTLLEKKNKIVILVTHQFNRISQADFVIAMKQGEMICKGAPSEVTSSSEFRSILKDSSLLINPEKSEMEDLTSPKVPSKHTQENDGKLMDDEERAVGAVSWSIYASYIKNCGVILFAFGLSTVLGLKGGNVLSDWWISVWSQDAETPNPQHTANYYLMVYVIIGAVVAGITILSQFVLTGISIRCSRVMHSKLLNRITFAKLNFFDQTPVGRILNRFSTDMDSIDRSLTDMAFATIYQTLIIFSSLLVQIIITPWFLIPIVPIVVMCYFVQRFYRASSIELQRLLSLSRSPVYAHFSQTLEGLPTIRAYQMEKAFSNQISEKIDKSQNVFLFLVTAFRWLGISLEFLSIILLTITTVAFAASAKYISAGLVGLCLSYTLSELNWMIRSYSYLEMQMNSVERVEHFASVPIEESVATTIPDKAWPSKGKVEIVDLCSQYRDDLPLVLKNISVEISPGQHVGICGRTGSGKSSFALALFKMIPKVKGKIMFDGVDIDTVPLNTLRSSMSVVPQDPVLFCDTIRYNLDPVGQFSDAELWKSLRSSQLESVVKDLPEGLDHKVAEGGQNFSVGQRQLFCVARALLKQSKILLLDEATASIDPQTDQILQKIIKTAFKGRTVFIIAHRIATILDCDKIMLLKNGKLEEFDSPTELLKNPNSAFASLVHSQTGKQQ